VNNRKERKMGNGRQGVFHFTSFPKKGGTEKVSHGFSEICGRGKRSLADRGQLAYKHGYEGKETNYKGSSRSGDRGGETGKKKEGYMQRKLS